MHRFDERLMLDETYRNMARQQRRATLMQALRSQERPPYRQRLARVLLEMAYRLAPDTDHGGGGMQLDAVR